jgi:CRISPR-associated protein Cmr3
VLPFPAHREALLLEPLDVLFCRGGRPYAAGHAASAELPTPQVIAGAIRTGLLTAEGLLPAAGTRIDDATFSRLITVRIRGPLLWRNGEPLVPVPADLVWNLKRGQGRRELSEGDTPIDGCPQGVRLRPMLNLPDFTAAKKDCPQWRPLWKKEPEGRRDFEPISGRWLPASALVGYLRGESVPVSTLVEAKDLYDQESLTHVGIDPESGTAQVGILFSQTVLRLRRGVCLYVEIDRAGWKPLPTSIAVGGDRHRCRVEVIKPDLRLDTLPTKGRTALLHLTPAIHAAPHWCASEWQSRLVSAAVGASQPVSGWDWRESRPKPTRYAVPGGSVYLLDGDVPIDTHGAQAGHLDDLAVGYGWTVAGTWNYAE